MIAAIILCIVAIVLMVAGVLVLNDALARPIERVSIAQFLAAFGLLISGAIVGTFGTGMLQ